MFKRISKYWWCQLLGWLGYFVGNIFFAYSFEGDVETPYVINLLLIIGCGLLATHVSRALLIKLNWFQFSFEAQMLLCLGLTISSGVILYIEYVIVGNLFRYSWQQKGFTDPKTVSELLSIFIITFIWWLIYFVWHYIERNGKAQVDKLKLESTVKELELKTIKAQLNPHFIFNALNSIRALVDENPKRARTAITELSNILRSSMQTDKAETVSLENELDIVKDYLALETIRFEERLQVSYEIDQETHALPVPPMMLQTLVENAIKHGISKLITGGNVIIRSHVHNMQHEITVENTGQIRDGETGHGFGLQSTRQRLSLLYGNKATFDIYNKNDETVEAKVSMPLF
jgi:two-component system, LytTR family, sensor kinase